MQSFGSTLRQERERRGISLEAISSSTKIRLLYLQAIEQDHLEELPGGLIGRGFVRAYARAIGIDEEETITAYLASRAESESQLVPPMPAQASPRGSNLATRLPSWAFVAGFLAIGVGFIVLGELRSHYPVFHGSGPESASPTSSRLASQRHTADEASLAQPATRQETVSRNVSPYPYEQSAKVAVSASTPTPDAGGLNLAINVRQDAWMSIIADGQRVISDTLVAPTEKVVKAHSQIVVRAGNIGAVDFTFNGKDLPSQGGYGEARWLRFDVHGLAPLVPKPVSPPDYTNSPSVPATPGKSIDPNVL